MELEKLPDLKRNQYKERITLAISSEAKQKLDILKNEKGKDVPSILRKMIEDFVDDVEAVV